MNKNKVSAAFILSCLLVTSQTASAEEQGYLSGFTSKVSQGFFNMVAGFIEIPKNIVNISSDENIFIGMTWGTLRGVVHAVNRTVIGRRRIYLLADTLRPIYCPALCMGKV